MELMRMKLNVHHAPGGRAQWGKCRDNLLLICRLSYSIPRLTPCCCSSRCVTCIRGLAEGEPSALPACCGSSGTAIVSSETCLSRRES